MERVLELPVERPVERDDARAAQRRGRPRGGTDLRPTLQLPLGAFCAAACVYWAGTQEVVRGRPPAPVVPLGDPLRLLGDRLAPVREQLVVRVGNVRVGHHHVREQLLPGRQLHPDGAPHSAVRARRPLGGLRRRLEEDPLDGGVEADVRPVALRHRLEPVADHLEAALRESVRGGPGGWDSECGSREAAGRGAGRAAARPAWQGRGPRVTYRLSRVAQRVLRALGYQTPSVSSVPARREKTAGPV